MPLISPNISQNTQTNERIIQILSIACKAIADSQPQYKTADNWAFNGLNSLRFMQNQRVFDNKIKNKVAPSKKNIY